MGYAPSMAPAMASTRTTGPVMDASKFQTFLDSPMANPTLEEPWEDSTEISDKAGLIALADKLNPIFGYFDPLNIGEKNKETIAWYRHAEIKHGRVAMAAFVGFTVQSLGVHFPWNLTPTTSFADIAAAGGPADQWDALPSAAKVQILLFIGFLEMVSESSVFLKMDGTKHYIRGGKPGYFPTISDKMPHPVPLNYFDPFGLTKKMTPERKEQGLLAEINNGRWAMIGIIGCMSVSKGLFVPGLDSLPIKPYGGEIMAPFSSVNSDLPFVSEMLAARAAQIAREAAILGDAYLNNGA